MLQAHERLLQAVPDALLVLVPRHPVRADEVLALAQHQGLRSERQRALDAQPPSGNPQGLQVIVADTMGQLQNLFGLAQVAFIGGSLVPVGGHDPIEAALWRIPMLMGPQRYNFPTVCESFAQVQALAEVVDATQLADRLLGWAQDEAARVRQGAAGAEVVAANTGAQQRTLLLLSAHIQQALATG